MLNDSIDLRCQSISILDKKKIDVNNFDEESKSELLAHVQLLLTSFGLTNSAKLLGEEIEKNGFVPKRFNFLGEPCNQSFNEYINRKKFFSSNLIELIKCLNQQTSEKIPSVISNLPIRLFSSKRQSLNRNIDVLKKTPQIDQIICKKPIISSAEKINFTKLIIAKELGSQCLFFSRLLLRKETLKNLRLHSRILGHLGPIYCVKFDITGQYIFTGADDNLIKVWDARSCLLRFTFRGHSSYIMDMTISPENTMIASGSMDKTIRVWCLQRGKTLMVYKGHTATISTISFIPYLKNDTRYLVSGGNDGTVVFFKYFASTKQFCEPPIKFNERTKPGSRIATMCHSPGGNLVVIGDTHQNIRIYQITENNVERLIQVSAHTDRVDSLVWAHNSMRFASGSKDGTAKVWFINKNSWTCSTLKVQPATTSSNTVLNTELNRTNNSITNQIDAPTNLSRKCRLNNKKTSYKVTMLCWTLSDDLVVTSGSDNLLRIWNWRTGDLLRVLSGHTDESFVLLSHPIHKEIVISVGHDAMLMIWNVYDGNCIKKHRNVSDNNELKAICDMSISSDGTIIGFGDNYGHLSILGLDQKLINLPSEQFFSTDYRPLSTDETGYVLDDLSGMAPENMEPPIFVNSEGIAHPDDFQRLVPGNDLISMEIDSICPWIARPIVPLLDENYHKLMLEKWEIIFQTEFNELTNSLNNLKNLSHQIDPDQRYLVPKPAKTNRSNCNYGRRAHIEQITNRLMNPPPGEPRYVICDEDDTDDDSSYTAGDDDSHHSDEGDTAHSSNVANHSDELGDEFDSDYEEGVPERPTVYRTRTAYTVTGRLKKRRVINLSDESANSSIINEPSSSNAINNESHSGRRRIDSPEKSPSFEYRRKRAAALSAQNIWRTEMVDLLPTTTMNLRNHQRNNYFINDCNKNLAGSSILKSKIIDNDSSDSTETKVFSNSTANKHKSINQTQKSQKKFSSEMPSTSNSYSLRNINRENHFESIKSNGNKTSNSSEYESEQHNSDKSYKSEAITSESSDRTLHNTYTNQTKNCVQYKSKKRNNVHLSANDNNFLDLNNFSKFSYSSTTSESTLSFESSNSFTKNNLSKKKKKLKTQTIKRNGAKSLKRKKKNNSSFVSAQVIKRPRRAAAAQVEHGCYEESEEDELFLTRQSERLTRAGRSIRINSRYLKNYDS